METVNFSSGHVAQRLMALGVEVRSAEDDPVAAL